MMPPTRVYNLQFTTKFFTKFDHVTLISLEVLHFFVTGHSHCHTPFLPVGPVNQLSFGFPLSNTELLSYPPAISKSLALGIGS